MKQDLDELRRDYQAIGAPPYLAGRITARAPQRRARFVGWWPAAVTAAVVLGVVVVLPTIREASVESQAVMPRSPSLSTLSRVAATRTPVVTPNLNRLRSLRPPSPPPRPTLRPATQPPAKDDRESHLREENHHDYV